MADDDKVYIVPKHNKNHRKHPRHRVTAYKSPVVCWKSTKKSIKLENEETQEVITNDDE